MKFNCTLLGFVKIGVLTAFPYFFWFSVVAQKRGLIVRSVKIGT